MDINQVKVTLERIFREKKKRIVFWYDTEKEFEDMLPSIQLDDVTILRLDEYGALELKIKLGVEDQTGNRRHPGEIHPVRTVCRTRP